MQTTLNAQNPECRLPRGVEIRFKLYLTYVLILALSVLIGVAVYRVSPDGMPRLVYSRLEELVCPHKNADFFDFLATIIYNSVDIFKISAIIIIVGFTYISAPLCRISLALWGVGGGWSLCYIMGGICNGALWSAAVGVCAVLYAAIVISACVRAELAADELGKIKNPRIMLNSRSFWSYILWLFVAFGYTVMVTVAYRLCLIFIL